MKRYRTRVRRNHCCLLLLLLVTQIIAITASGQELFTQPPAKKITSFGFKTFSGGVIIVRARLDNYEDSLNFILDTGSGGISLDSTACIRIKIPTTPSDKTIRGIAGVRNVKFAYNHALHLPGLKVDSLNFHINDYDILTSVYGERIDGIIGFSFFNKFIVKIDYDSSKITVYNKGMMKYPRGGYLLKPLIINIPVMDADLKENTNAYGRYYFDTGAGLCLLLSSDFVADSTIFSTKKKMVVTQAEGLGGKTSMKLTTVKELKMGPFKFKKVPTYVFDDDYNVTSYPYLGGLIGNDLLRRFNAIINYERRDIYLTPNTHYREPFDYSYTGLGFYNIDNKIVVTDVMKGSPAEEAGFLVNDIIFSVNNNISGNIQTYKNLIQNPGEKNKIIVMRNGIPKELKLKVISILK